MMSADTRQPLAVAGVFRSRQAASAAIDGLLQAGLDRARISIVLSHGRSADDTVASDIRETKAGDFGKTGAGAGAAVGGAAGILAGLGLIGIAGIGPLLAVGPLVAGLAGATAGDTAGGLTGSLIGLGIDADEAARYTKVVRDDGIVVVVSCDSKRMCDEIQARLEASGAEDVSGHHFLQGEISDNLMLY